jgi:oxygen-independent coproporphyrinogen-3 oxidase
MAKAAGFEHINVDMIYGTPGESLDDLLQTLDSIDFAKVDHVSAYALIVEEGTRLAKKIERGEIPMPDDDDLADKYELIDAHLSRQGMTWYEVSNWSKPAGECRHNVRYWMSDNWWGVGPGAHSHVGGVRWWNHKHPAAWTKALATGTSPALAHERLTSEQQREESVMLQLRLAAGVDLAILDNGHTVRELVESGLLELKNDRAVLTPRGRLLADAVIRDLLF